MTEIKVKNRGDIHSFPFQALVLWLGNGLGKAIRTLEALDPTLLNLHLSPCMGTD